MTVKPKYYFNLDGNITDGEKEYSLYNIEDRIGGLNVNSNLKERYVLYGKNSLLDLLNALNDENEQLKSFKNKVFSLLADEIKKENELLDYYIKEKVSCNADRQQIIIGVLKRLQKELEE